MKRAMDICLSGTILLLGFLPMILIALVVKLTSRGPMLYWSQRLGKDNRIFWMPKFRTMWIEAPEVATRDLNDPNRWLTPFGSLLRSTSLDELPQLWSILKGDMSFVGPRPVLRCERELIALRTAHGIHKLPVGLTGWAQVNGRDELAVPEKVAYELSYLQNYTFRLDLKILFLTFWKVLSREGTIVPRQPQPVVNETASERKAA